MKTQLRLVLSTIVATTFLGSSFLSSAALTPSSTIAYPTYTLITDSLFSLVPNIGKKRDDSMMQLLCQIARDEVTREEANKVLTDKGYELDMIPETGHTVSLWVNNDKAGQKAACAAYIATSLYLPQNNKEFLAKPDDPKSVEIDKEKFAEVMRVRFSVADANAEIFALMVNNLDANNSIEAYQMQIEKMFTDLAPLYLDRIRALYTAKEGTMTLLDIKGDDYSVIDNEGRRLNYQQGQLDYTVRGVNWLGNGKILGQESFVNVHYFSQQDASALPVEEKELKPKKSHKK